MLDRQFSPDARHASVTLRVGQLLSHVVGSAVPLVVTFHNRMALFLWGFAAVWLAMLVAMTYVALRDGPPAGTSLPMIVLVISIFWIFGIGLVAFTSTQPCLFVTVDRGNRVTVTWRYPQDVARHERGACNGHQREG